VEAWFNRAWYERSSPHWWLLPFEWLFVALSGLRRKLYARGILRSHRFDVPVVVIGNIAVGGTGKTPLVIHLARQLSAAGRKPGIVSRGHGVRLSEPLLVRADDPASRAGDEPLLLQRESGVPVCIFPDRVRAVSHLLNNRDVDIVLCDDGLQHYALERDIEFVLLDGKRGIGNGHRLPAGPLREPVSRLENVDQVIVQGKRDASFIDSRVRVDAVMQLVPRALTRLHDGARLDIAGGLPDDLTKDVLAIAGIGNPQRFFDSLAAIGIHAETRSFTDHHFFTVDDFSAVRGRAVIMTAKDAVKCSSFAQRNWWYLDVEPVLEPDPVAYILDRIAAGKRSAD
jgi:tetraacyldisaccharide 4'-kinase